MVNTTSAPKSCRNELDIFKYTERASHIEMTAASDFAFVQSHLLKPHLEIINKLFFWRGGGVYLLFSLSNSRINGALKS